MNWFSFWNKSCLCLCSCCGWDTMIPLWWIMKWKLPKIISLHQLYAALKLSLYRCDHVAPRWRTAFELLAGFRGNGSFWAQKMMFWLGNCSFQLKERKEVRRWSRQASILKLSFWEWNVRDRSRAMQPVPGTLTVKLLAMTTWSPWGFACFKCGRLNLI